MSKKSTTVVLSARELRKKLKEGYTFETRDIADEDIDCSDIPELTEEQLRQFKRVKRPRVSRRR